MVAEYSSPTLIEVMSPHCVECRAMKPDLDAVADQNAHVDLVVLDATRESERVASLQVKGTPTLIAVKDGIELARFTGRRSRAELTELFAAVADGDLTTVSSTSRGDRVVWATAGVLLAVAGLLSGPSWAIVAVGFALGGSAWLRSLR